MAEPGVVPLSQAHAEGEVALLKRAQALGFPVAPTWVVDLEEEFFRLNNLEERLEALFRGVFGVRIDEERLLLASEEAVRAVKESYLLPERAEAFLEVLKGKGPFLLRYAGRGFGKGKDPREALFALKRLYSERFRVEAVLQRHPRLIPPFTPVLVQEVEEAGEDPFLSLDLSQALGREVVVFAHQGLLVRVESPYGG
jgi:hypothetical protein